MSYHCSCCYNARRHPYLPNPSFFAGNQLGNSAISQPQPITYGTSITYVSSQPSLQPQSILNTYGEPLAKETSPHLLSDSSPYPNIPEIFWNALPSEQISPPMPILQPVNHPLVDGLVGINIVNTGESFPYDSTSPSTSAQSSLSTSPSDPSSLPNRSETTFVPWGGADSSLRPSRSRKRTPPVSFPASVEELRARLVATGIDSYLVSIICDFIFAQGLCYDALSRPMNREECDWFGFPKGGPVYLLLLATKAKPDQENVATSCKKRKNRRTVDCTGRQPREYKPRTDASLQYTCALCANAEPCANPREAFRHVMKDHLGVGRRCVALGCTKVAFSSSELSRHRVHAHQDP